MSVDRKVKPVDIILAVDGSEHSYAAARLVGDLALPKESKITVLAVMIPRDASNHAALQSVLDEAEKLLREKAAKVSTLLLTGYPAEQISEYAEKNPPDLIVLGAKGRRATLGILLGGVVQQIVEYANHPVLVVRAPYHGLRKAVVITDGSEHSQKAIRYLSRLPLPADCEVRAVHVLPPLPSPAFIARSWPVGSEAMAPVPSFETEQLLTRQAEEEERQGRLLLEQAVKMLADEGLEATSALLRGDAASEIIQYVTAHQIDLIVAGSRGLSQMKRLLLGSLSRKLVHYASCSVLIVKGAPHVLD